MKKSPTNFNVLLTFVLLSSVACTPNFPPSTVSLSNPKSATPAANSPQNILEIAIIPSVSSTQQQDKIQLLEDYLNQELNQTVKIKLTKDYETGVNLLVTGQVEVAYLGPLAYIKAKQRNSDLEPIVAHIEKTTGRPWYTSVMVVNRQAGINTPADIKGKRFSFVSPSSASGFLFPSAEFKRLGITPNQDFSQVQYSGGHDKNIVALAEGKVDAIAVDKSVYIEAVKQNKLPENKYKMIWESDPIPNSPFVISSTLPLELKTKFQRALINAPEGLVAVGGTTATGYTIVQDEDYEPIRKLQAFLLLESPAQNP
ncbi:phosphate/phosphite/phosphonate ABC transporter substrate-binding protein [Planktothrix paucivesiculata]|uniref:Phosphonate ABC transporter, periplasmic phosphonate-binding protein n=1 Tax=Planktothrix paucivesiculata PCC 9631 TaxID=671071 RepID=A0A7Z9BP18_9CYAN|nr:phosphate/phosphite/phosphonate ABC transporter substrate-binding protein [Planktothrix paucivesiculata]VXD19272.1 Phosphonate ABC transporter, periplasmic phosphonate-binding protein [Planktothrix paucivesiculata PCC 9631]